jgi:hypothetical protein
MARQSKLTEKQWHEVARRLLAGEKGRVLAREFGVSETAIRKRLGSQTTEIKTVSHQLFVAEVAFKALPTGSQIAARNFVDDLHAMNMHMAAAGKYNSATSHRLAGLAHSQIEKVDDADPLGSYDILQGVAALLKLSNDAATIPLGLIKSNQEQMRDAQEDKAAAVLAALPMDGNQAARAYQQMIEGNK